MIMAFAEIIPIEKVTQLRLSKHPKAQDILDGMVEQAKQFVADCIAIGFERRKLEPEWGSEVVYKITEDSIGIRVEGRQRIDEESYRYFMAKGGDKSIVFNRQLVTEEGVYNA